jgi:RNA polymerase sigma factor (sigma-70 family)
LHNLPDITLWQAFKTGDRAAFAELYRRYVKVLYNYGSKFSADKALLEDAVQDLFTDLWRMKGNLSDTDSVKFYLFRSLRRLIHKQIEAESIFSDLNINQNLEAIFAAEPSFEQIQIGQDTEEILKKRLTEALATLPKRQHEALNLRFYEYFEYSQIADIMGVNEQSARNFVQKALQTLRQSF